MKGSFYGLWLLFASCPLAACTAEAPGPNRPPVAIAGPDQIVQVGQPAILDGSASYDPDGIIKGYHWRLLAAPPQHQADLINTTLFRAVLVPDRPGTWLVQLIVNDGELESLPDVVRVLAQPACQTDQDGDGYISSACAGGTDCDDSDPAVYPGAQESGPNDPTCHDGKDNDCDGLTDAADPGCWHCSADGDCADGNSCTTDLCVDHACQNPPVTDGAICDDNLFCTEADACSGGVCVGKNKACDDSNACTQDVCNETERACHHTLVPIPGAEGPAGSSTCTDGNDNDCDGLTDGDDPNCSTTCVDLDGDGYGNPGDPSCPKGSATDCDDDPNHCGAACHPGAIEVCDGWDNNCDGQTDENGAFPGWWNKGWLSRRKLTFNNSMQPSILTQFPVLLVLSPQRIDYGKLKTDGSDLRFIASDNTTVLPYHTEGWAPAATNFVWVKVPSIAGGSSSDFIWMYHHNASAPDVRDPAGTYEPGFIGVWHLNEIVTDEQTSGSFADSTSHANNGQQVKNADTPGKIGLGQLFDGNDDYIRIPYNQSLDLAAAWTIETWVNPTYFTGSWQALISKDMDGDQNNRAASLWLDDDYVEVWYTPRGRVLLSNHTLASGTWTYLAATFNGSNLYLYINGDLDKSVPANTPDTNTYDLYFGQRGQNTRGYFYGGGLDEVRLSSTTRGADWIKAQYLSMTDQFVTFGAEEDTCP